MFTLDRATRIFPETQSADVVPALTARYNLLSAEDQLALIWYAYLEMGKTITIAAPGAARMQFAEPMLNRIRVMNFAEQSQVMCDLANHADTELAHGRAEEPAGLRDAHERAAVRKRLDAGDVAAILLPVALPDDLCGGRRGPGARRGARRNEALGRWHGLAAAEAVV